MIERFLALTSSRNPETTDEHWYTLIEEESGWHVPWVFEGRVVVGINSLVLTGTRVHPS
jgi:hypothetical protein